MAEDLIPILTRFHREIVLPDIERVVGGLRDEMNDRFAAQDAHFDAICQRFDRLARRKPHACGDGAEEGDSGLSRDRR